MLVRLLAARASICVLSVLLGSGDRFKGVLRSRITFRSIEIKRSLAQTALKCHGTDLWAQTFSRGNTSQHFTHLVHHLVDLKEWVNLKSIFSGNFSVRY